MTLELLRMNLDTILLAVLIATQVADVVTTLRILALGGRELNPVMAKAMDLLGREAGLILPKVALVAAVILLHAPQWLIGVVIAFYACIVANNVSVWRRLRK